MCDPVTNPDTVKNASVFAAVPGTAGGPSQVLTWLFGVFLTCSLLHHHEMRKNPVSCALIRADTAVLFTIVSMMHMKK